VSAKFGRAPAIVIAWIGRAFATVAAALVLTYVGTAALSEVGDFGLWPASLTWLGVAAVVCGALLALIGGGAAWSMVAASVLAALLFAGLWNMIYWTFLGVYVDFFEITISNPFLYQVLPRCAIIVLTTAPLGLIGVVAATILLPERYRL
jgi:hypothetical protein